MIARRVPATPLPWRHAKGYVNASDGMTVADADEDAAYIAHACNAYPKLVEALRGVQDAYQHHFDEMPAAWQTQDSMIADLLRELGEGE